MPPFLRRLASRALPAYPGLDEVTVVTREGGRSSGTGVWGPYREPCWFVAATGMPRNAAALASLRAESQILKRLDGVHGVARLLQVDASMGLMVQSLATGITLAARPPLADARPTRDELRRCIAIALAVLDVLEQVHAAGIFHGKLSPSNVIVDESLEDGEVRVTLVDFSGAYAQSHVDAQPQSGRVTRYAAPEQTGRMHRGADYRVDFYALGAMLYRLLRGAAPFTEAEPLRLLHALLTRPPPPFGAGVPSGLAAVIFKLLAKRPEDRFQSAHGLRVDLQYCLATLDDAVADANFTAGRADHRIRPAQPSRLFGRDDELALLQRAMQAPPERRRVVLLRGYSGAGKSALVRAMQPWLAQRGGMLASGKYDQFQRLTPYAGLTEALSDLARSWLSEAPAQLAQRRARLLARLGANAQYLARLSPGFSTLLAVPVRAERRGIDRAHAPERMLQALHCIFGELRGERHTAPLLLFIDDAQFADADSLQLLQGLAAEDSHGAVLLVCAYRDNEVDAAHPLAEMLGRLRHRGIELIEIALDGLNDVAVQDLLADVLDAEPQAIAPLAAGLFRKTRGNAFFLLQYLRRLHDAGQLRRVEGRWRWDAAALDALPSSENLIGGLLEDLHHLPHDLQMLAGICACLGGSLDPDLLAAVLGVAPGHVDALLMPLMQRDLLLAVAPRGADAVAASGARARSLHFCHDRMQLAAHALLDADERARWHLAIARVLARDANAGAAFDAADHYLAALPMLGDGAERAQAAAVLIDAARASLDRGAYAAALRFVDGAATLHSSHSPNAELGLQLDLTRHGVLYGLGRHEEADALFERLAAGVRSGNAAKALLGIAPAMSRQVASLAQRGRYEDAVRLGLDAIGKLGVECPADTAWPEALRTETEWLRRLVADEGAARFETLRPIADASFECAALMLVSMHTAAYVWRPDVSGWLRLRVLRLAAEQGRFASLPVALMSVMPALAGAEGYAVAGQLARAALRLQEAHPVAEYAPAVLQRRAALIAHWFEPLERAALDAHEADRLATVIGDVEIACLAQYPLLAVTLECALDLGEIEQRIAAALPAIAAAHNPDAAACFRVYGQLLRVLRGETATPGQLDDAAFRMAASQQIAASPMAQAFLALFGSLGATVFGDWALALAEARKAALLRGFVEGQYCSWLQRWLHALALCRAMRFGTAAERPALQEELRPLRNWLRRRADDVPVNFGHGLDLVDAMQAWADGDLALSAAAFDRAIAGALQHHRPYHYALACELAAEFHVAQGTSATAQPYRRAAARAYDAWGATGKLRQLRSEFRSEAGEQASHVRAPAVANAEDPLRAAMLGLGGLWRAERGRARPVQPHRLLRDVMDLVRRYAGAERGVLFWREGEHWVARAAFRAQVDAVSVSLRNPLPESAAAVPRPVFNYLTQTLEPLLLQDAARWPHFGAEAAAAMQGIRSIIGLPIHHRGAVVGLLYLENRSTGATLAPVHLETLRLAGLQLQLAYDDALVRRHLLAASSPGSRPGSRPDSPHPSPTRPAEPGSLLTLLTQSLDVRSPEAGPLAVSSAEFQMKDVLESLARLLSWRAEAQEVELLFDVATPLPDVLVGDPALLVQTLASLGHDALQSGGPGEVRVTVEASAPTHDGTHVKFQVRHAGVDAAGKADGASASAEAQSGYGVARYLVERMGGRMETALLADGSASVGFGLRFGLPATAVTAAARPMPPVNAPPGPSQAARVLVVDDNASAREILAGMTRAIGLPVQEARDGWDALRAVSLAAQADEPFDLILIDWRMPGMDGVECARQMIASHPELAGKLVMMSASGSAQVKAELGNRKVTVRDVLAKPVTPSTLLDTFAGLLGRRALQIAGPVATRATGAASTLRDRLRGARLLLVEDNAINQELALELLSDAGAVVTLAEDGRQALDRLAAERFDAVLMDCQMPIMDGYEATRAIRRQPAWRQLPVIAMTAGVTPVDLERARIAGMNDHIGKPIDVPTMFDTIARWLPAPEALPAAAPRSGAPTALASVLAALPGIDSRIGLARTLGDERLYRRLLLLFREEQRHFPALFESAVASGDPTTARRLVTTLRSIAGSLGAVALEAVSATLTAACQGEIRRDAIDPELAAVTTQLALVVAGLRMLGAAAPSA